VRYEDAVVTGDRLEGPSEEGRHIRRAGEECRAGDQLLPAGVVVDPAVLGLAATVGLNRLTVIPPPTVASLVTGDELVHRGPSGPGRVRDAIGPMLPGLITRAGAVSADAPEQMAAAGATPQPDQIVGANATPQPEQMAAAGATPQPEHTVGAGATPQPEHTVAAGATPQAEQIVGAGATPQAEQIAGAGATPQAEQIAGAGATPQPDQIVGAGATPQPEQIAGAGATPQPEQFRGAGAGRPPVRHLPDSREELIRALDETQADLILVSGSSAAGPADHLRPALSALEAEFIVDGVACRPGHPQALARLTDGRLVLGLPGNPFAALVAFLTIGVATISRMRGLPLPELTHIAVPGGIPCHPTSTRLVPVRLTPQGAVPVGHGGAAMLRGPAIADALAVVAPGPAEAIAARLLPLKPTAHSWPL
jgi:molybdopterin biosynthesis enzyme